VCVYFVFTNLQDQSSKHHSLMGFHATDPMQHLGPAPYDPV